MTVAALILLIPALLAPAAGPSAPIPWVPPVTPLVVERPFAAPSGPYGPGHRGVDLAAAAGAPVRASGAGVVRVAGTVAGKRIVSIEHSHRILGRTGWRTTYEGVATVVSVGERVRPGQVIGRVVSHAHGPGIHWGLKNGRTYADPLVLLRPSAVLKPLRR